MPFTTDEFFSVFSHYNEAIWPLHVVAYLSALIAIRALLFATRWHAKMITMILALMWAINGLGYHWLYFTEVNPAAWAFGALFLAQSLALAGYTYVFPGIRFAILRDARSAIGLCLVVFATVVYPIWGWLAGHIYPAIPMFGVAPCPTTIFTVGVLLVGSWKAVRWLLIIPILWAAIGGSAAILLDVPQDYGLIATMLIGVAIALGRWFAFSFACHFC